MPLPKINRIGLIGLGKIGSRVALKLLEAGKSLFVYDVDEKRMEKIILKGAIPKDNAYKIGLECEIIFLSLPSPEIIKTVVIGKDGILSACRKGIFIVDLSTNSYENVVELDRKCRLSGIKFIDAPFTGGIYGLEEGTVTIMVGGEESDVNLVKPILELFAAKIVYMGPTGFGAATKLIHNMLGEIQVYALAEAFSMAAKFGLDISNFYSVLSHSMAGSRILTELYGKGALRREFKPRATVNTAAKDQQLLVELARKINVNLTFTPIVLQMIKELQSKGFGELDVTSALLLFEDKNKVKVNVIEDIKVLS